MPMMDQLRRCGVSYGVYKKYLAQGGVVGLGSCQLGGGCLGLCEQVGPVCPQLPALLPQPHQLGMRLQRTAFASRRLIILSCPCFTSDVLGSVSLHHNTRLLRDSCACCQTDNAPSLRSPFWEWKDESAGMQLLAAFVMWPTPSSEPAAGIHTPGQLLQSPPLALHMQGAGKVDKVSDGKRAILPIRLQQIPDSCLFWAGDTCCDLLGQIIISSDCAQACCRKQSMCRFCGVS